jgi:O-antigen/teichoic acid export membrane protein
LNLELNLLLIPDYGMMGAAGATLASYVLLPVGAYLVSRRYRVVHYEWGRAIKILLAITLIYVASIFVDRSYSAMHSHISATYAHLVVGVCKVLLLLCYPILLYAIGFFRPEEIQMTRTVVRSARGYVARRLGRKPNSPDGPSSTGQ